MFTGLVADLGTVARLDLGSDGARLRIETDLAAELGPGDSVAVNGVCLTALEPADGAFEADVIAETLRRSSLGALAVGSRANLELPLRASDRLGGHVVLGHVDGLGEVTGPTQPGSSGTVALEPALLRYVVEKGSIALDGVSLTVAAVDATSLTVALIPETPADHPRWRATGAPRQRRGRRAGQASREAGGRVRRRTSTEVAATPFATIDEAIEEIREGRMVVVCDDEDRENEGDLVMAAQFATPEAINFMAKEGRGWICLALTPERCDELGLDLMTAKNEIAAADAVHDHDRGARRRHDGGLGPRPGAHDAGRDRPAHASA